MTTWQKAYSSGRYVVSSPAGRYLAVLDDHGNLIAVM